MANKNEENSMWTELKVQLFHVLMIQLYLYEPEVMHL